MISSGPAMVPMLASCSHGLRSFVGHERSGPLDAANDASEDSGTNGEKLITRMLVIRWPVTSCS